MDFYQQGSFFQDKGGPLSSLVKGIIYKYLLGRKPGTRMKKGRKRKKMGTRPEDDGDKKNRHKTTSPIWASVGASSDGIYFVTISNTHTHTHRQTHTNRHTQRGFHLFWNALGTSNVRARRPMFLAASIDICVVAPPDVIAGVETERQKDRQTCLPVCVRFFLG